MRNHKGRNQVSHSNNPRDYTFLTTKDVISKSDFESLTILVGKMPNPLIQRPSVGANGAVFPVLLSYHNMKVVIVVPVCFRTSPKRIS